MTNLELSNFLIDNGYIENDKYKGCFEKNKLRFDLTYYYDDNNPGDWWKDILKIEDFSEEIICNGSEGYGWIGKYNTRVLNNFKKSKMNKELLKGLIKYYEGIYK